MSDRPAWNKSVSWAAKRETPRRSTSVLPWWFDVPRNQWATKVAEENKRMNPVTSFDYQTEARRSERE